MNARRILIIGGGAAGFFAAIRAAEAAPGARVSILEKSGQFLGKVRISGGGRCNVTHNCFDPRAFTQRYPRGERALLGPMQQFQATDTVAWFESRGVKLKTEADGRMFPTTDSSETIIDCLMTSARNARVQLLPNQTVARLEKAGDSFRASLSNGTALEADRVLLATGGCRAASAGELAVGLGHRLTDSVPSLFTFHVDAPWIRELSGVSIERAIASVPDTKLREEGPLLLTHWGVSGPVVLRLSAWGARVLHGLDYKFTLRINWLPQSSVEQVTQELRSRRQSQPAKLVVNAPIAPLTARLWEALVLVSGIPRETRLADLSSQTQHQLTQQLTRTELPVTGKSLNKDEFVTCGGVKLAEVNFKTMESRICPGLFFAGELLDIDGITGGFNFQAAWTTGYIAGTAMATA